MKKRTLLAMALAVGGAVVLRRGLGFREDVDWETVEKPGKIIDVDGYRVHYVEQGAGPAIVLVHGFGGNTSSFRRLMPLLATDHRAIAVDLKGYGYSERDAHAGLSQSDQVAMLKRLLSELGVARAIFVGHSMGGAVVQRFAATHPEMVEAVVLAASVTGDERYRRFAPPPALLGPVAPVLGRVVAARLLKLSFYDAALLTDDVRAAYLRPLRIKGSMAGLLASMRDAASDPPVDLSRVTMPVLLLYGADDRAVPLSAAQSLRARMPHARLVVIDRAAHLLLEERPGECARAIRDFLRDAGMSPRSPSVPGAP